LKNLNNMKLEHQHFNRIKQIINNPNNKKIHNRAIFKMITTFYVIFKNEELYLLLLKNLAK